MFLQFDVSLFNAAVAKRAINQGTLWRAKLRNVQIICAANPASTYARFDSYVMPLRSVNDITLGPLDLLLAGLGADTGQVVMDWSANTDVFVDAVYVELALHNEAPWQAI